MNQNHHDVPAVLRDNLARTIRSSRLVRASLPLVPNIELFLLRPDYPVGKLDDQEMLAIINEPAYWAFCWASGQVLADYIVNRTDLVRGKRVLDLGCGSGIVAIAAAAAGASSVIACDTDPMALDAARANADLNHAELTLCDDLSNVPGPIDLIIAADVLYDRDNMSLLDTLPGLSDEVLIADSRVGDVSIHGYTMVHAQQATTVPDLSEFHEFNQVKVFRNNPPDPA